MCIGSYGTSLVIVDSTVAVGPTVTFGSTVTVGTKIYKNGEEISFEELKEGDTLRIQYTNYKCNGKDDTGGSYDVLDTVVVLDEDITYARKARGVITRIDEGKTGGENYFYVTFCDGNYCAIAEDTTIIKIREDGTEFAIDKARLRAGMTIDVFFEDQSYDLVPTWLYPCKKIVIDTTVPISTPSVNPSDTPAPLVIPTVQPPVKPAKPVIYLYPEKEQCLFFLPRIESLLLQFCK